MRATTQRGAALRGIRSSRRWAIAIMILIAGLLVRADLAVIDTTMQVDDAGQNLEYGFMLGTTGRFATENGDLTMYREPLPVVGIALQVRYDPRLAGVTLDDLRADGPAVRALKQQNLLWGALLLAGVALQVWRSTWRHRGQLAVVAVVVVHLVLIEAVAHRNLSELPAAAFIVWAGVLAHAIVGTGLRGSRRRILLQGALLGVALALAALTKASVLPIGAVYLAVLTLLVIIRDRRGSGQSAVALMVALLVAASLTGPWMLRNAAEFGAFSIADRGGLSLWYRAIYEDATPRELRASWYVFTPPPAQPIVGRLLGISDEELETGLPRVHRDALRGRDDALSFYQLARRDRSELTAGFIQAGVAPQQARVRADQVLLERSLEVLRRDPGFFLRTTPLMLWRGMWPVPRAPLVATPLLGLMSVAGMVALLTAGALAVLRRSPGLFAIVGIPFGLVLFSAMFTLFWPRFSQPALPTMVVLFAMALDRAELRRGARPPE